MELQEKEKTCTSGSNDEYFCSSHNQTENCRTSGSTEDSSNILLCRVCHCLESDQRGDGALSLLDIVPPSEAISEFNKQCELDEKTTKSAAEKGESQSGKETRLVEFFSPDGEVLVCADLESCSYDYQDTLIYLGCACKNDLSLAHYACALKWFISHGSTVCEICGTVAKNIRLADFIKVMAALKEYESLREKTAMGELDHLHASINSGVDPDALAAIRRQRLSEVSFWFNPQNDPVAVPQEATADQISTAPTDNVVDNSTTKWAFEGTGILVATGLLTVTLAWLIAPHVGKRTARNGLHILLGGITALTVVIFLRFVVLSRIKYGPARYWAILFVFWFLVFGIWASRTHGGHST
ncbi:hypothetical protein HPP92_006885 [Vanilla planifolia]|uniref:RING-CH-type domain-containing protein n=1 Tax=Vanilla planifolia TaxID=51239 RepID=A0A835RBM6_VANPL|nr:hypothetical protein HPP92_006885 [Vanilla planifolia]